MEIIKDVFAGIGVIATVFVICFFLTWIIAALVSRRKWYPVSHPPSDYRKVIVLVNGEERIGWRGMSGLWFMYPRENQYVPDCIRCYPTKWREI